MRISHFEDSFNKRTAARDRDQRGRLVLGCVAMSLHRINENTYRITYIYTLPTLRRNGYASMALAWVCKLADEYQINLELCPVKLEPDSPDVVRLTFWYQSFGFMRIGLQDEMIRYCAREFQERNHHATKTPYLVQ